MMKRKPAAKPYIGLFARKDLNDIEIRYPFPDYDRIVHRYPDVNPLDYRSAALIYNTLLLHHYHQHGGSSMLMENGTISSIQKKHALYEDIIANAVTRAVNSNLHLSLCQGVTLNHA